MQKYFQYHRHPFGRHLKTSNDIIFPTSTLVALIILPRSLLRDLVFSSNESKVIYLQLLFDRATN